MSIDAKVESVTRYENGSGCLTLVDLRDCGCGDEFALLFDDSPADVKCLEGRNIWGVTGLVCQGLDFADRVGFGSIQFTVTDFHGLRHPNPR